MDYKKVLEEKVPFHARIYPWHVPADGRKFEKWPNEDLHEESDEMGEVEDIDDSKYEYVPALEIRRALKNDDEEKEFEEYFAEIEYFNGEVVDHGMYDIFAGGDEDDIRKFNWGIKNFKIFHIWNISLNKKISTFLPWSAKFQSDENEIEIEIQSHEKNENESSQTKVVHFSVDTQACDVPLFAVVDDCKIKYSLLSNAIRGKFEIRAYNDDGSPAHDVDGHIRAFFGYRGHYEKYIFSGHMKCERGKQTAENTLMLSPSSLIIPSDLGFVNFEISLEDKGGKFMVKRTEAVLTRTVAIDEQHLILGKRGYIIFTTIWSCLCVESKHGICTCPGIAMGVFQSEENDNACDPTATYEEDGVEGGTKRGKIIQPRQICSTTEEATSGDENSK